MMGHDSEVVDVFSLNFFWNMPNPFMVVSSASPGPHPHPLSLVPILILSHQNVTPEPLDATAQAQPLLPKAMYHFYDPLCPIGVSAMKCELFLWSSRL